MQVQDHIAFLFFKWRPKNTARMLKLSQNYTWLILVDQKVRIMVSRELSFLGAGKNGAEGQQFKEAVCINSSLHFLQQVIVCLNKKSKGEQTYIPYRYYERIHFSLCNRNSMMTMVLRDSIGGNCKTKMIANISADPEDVCKKIILFHS
jgi:hypothetical protein